MCNFEQALATCKDYSHELDYDEAIETIRVVVNKTNHTDLTERMTKLGYMEKSSYKIGTKYSVVYQRDYFEEDDDIIFPDTGEAPR